MKKTTIDCIFSALAGSEPEPETELNYTNHYTLLVAVILSAQATDKGVNKATPALFAVADTPEKMLALGEDGLKQYIKTIGLFNSKAKHIIAMSRQLVEAHAGEVPQDRDALEALPGVGRKTANVVANCLWGAPVIAVDTHVHRVSNRLGLCDTKNPQQTERALDTCIPDEWKVHAHHWLILLGRYICKARKPECWRCNVREWCEYTPKTPSRNN